MRIIQLYSLAGFQLFSEKGVEEWNIYFWYFSQVEMTERGKIKASPGKQGLQGKRSGENLICFLVEKDNRGAWQEKNRSFDFSEAKNEGSIFNEHNSTVVNAVRSVYASQSIWPRALIKIKNHDPQMFQ